MTGWRAAAKAAAGAAVAAASPISFSRCIFVFGHMRCGSTALANVLCSHPQVSGFGEAHIAYRSAAALGVLALSQVRRRTVRRTSRYLFDKILHSRYDAAAPAAFFDAAAVFMIREPTASIRSIRTLFSAIGSREYATDALAADYYETRLRDLRKLWTRFPADRRIGMDHAALVGNPDAELARVSALIGLQPALSNRYDAAAVAARRGSGDPLSSRQFSSIVDGTMATTIVTSTLPAFPKERLSGLTEAYSETARLIGASRLP